ncbi:hypothetical protein PRZ48_012169 [Zasmidium cellare]|uniref:Major facilitator superfamily (MFS) profile domain-containing protein n=1 Tax=Zasmidium cellare TaxID=395010 RepID=A0ABR0E456_ZASCE|nr:hypothetical protein PRZ48_012169 [Zasmidium cellare]
MEKPHPKTTSSHSPIRNEQGIKLEPQPNGPKDPLTWPLSKKIITLAIISFCAFVGQAQAQASTAGIEIQAELYHKTPTELSYGTSAGAAGIATGPIFWLALSNYIGRTATMFWALLGALGCSIWSSAMTGQGDYVAFVVSRWAGAHFGSVGSTFGASVILEVFYLHQRGKAFACYTTSILFGVNLGATISGFIAGSAPWPAQYWYFIGVQGICIILVSLLLEDTTYDRQNQQKGRPTSQPPPTYLHRRLQLLFAGHRTISPSPIPHGPLDSIVIGLQPITILCGLFSLITFGWAVAVTVLVPVFLQTPVSQGGYGFTPTANASFSFVTWISAAFGQLYGLLCNDRIPLWRCRRNGGVWKPEFRLWPALLPHVFLLPIGLGIFGAALQYHLPWEVLALGILLLQISEIAVTPIVVNYVSECFVAHPSEVFVMLQFYRLVLGCTVAFFINPWVDAVGAGWTFGMMAFFCLVGFAVMGVLEWRGGVIRGWSMAKFGHSEEGEGLFRSGTEEAEKE